MSDISGGRIIADFDKTYLLSQGSGKVWENDISIG